MEQEACDCKNIKQDEIYSEEGKCFVTGECTECGQVYEGVINND